jgi:DNA-binding NarL/FixJ family response regulator
VRAAYRRASAAIASLGDRRQRPRANRELRALRRELVGYGALRYVRSIDAALKRRGRERPTEILTSREERVARLVSRGWTDRRIAHELGVTAAQASRLVRSVQRRLGVMTRAQVASWVASRGGGVLEPAR